MKAYSNSNASGSANKTPYYNPSDTVYFDDNVSFTGTCAQVTFTLTLRDGSANLIRTLAGTTYNVGTTGSLNMSSDIFGGTQSWPVPASGSTGAYTVRLNAGSKGINNEYTETQIYIVPPTNIVISGT